MSKIKTEKEFLASQGDWFFLRLLLAVNMKSTVQEKIDLYENNKIVVSTFPEIGTYTIKMKDLVNKALDEFAGFEDSLDKDLQQMVIENNTSVNKIFEHYAKSE